MAATAGGRCAEIARRLDEPMAGTAPSSERWLGLEWPDSWPADVGRVDEDGFYYIVDRKKDLIIRGGYNVYPREIEEVFYEHPAVLEAAVIGIAHPTHGEEVGAAVTLRPGVEATADDLREYVKQRVAAYKYPRVVWLVDSLPKGPTGKLLKREIVPPEIS